MFKKIVLVVMIFVLFACSSTQKSESFNFELNDINGNVVKLEQFKGKKVYLKMWASWCSICLASLEETDELAKNDDFVVLSMVAPSIRGEQDQESFVKWFKTLEYNNLSVLLDEGGKVMEQLGVFAYPSYAFFDEDGKLTKSGPGHLSAEKIEELLNN